MSEIRRALETDYEVIHKLSFDLGYQPEISMVRESLRKILQHPDYEVAVIVEDGKVVGWMNLCVRYRIEDNPFLQIIAVVIDPTKRGMGLGKKFLNYAETQAKKKNLKLIGLYSNKTRIETHKFYRAQGFQETKESFFFTKNIEPK